MAPLHSKPLLQFFPCEFYYTQGDSEAISPYHIYARCFHAMM